MAYQSFPPAPGELAAESYVDRVVRPEFGKPVRVPTMEDQRAIKSTCLEALAQTSDFKTVMGYYVKSPYAVNTLPPDFDIGATHEWSEVIAMAHQAQNHYANHAKGAHGTATRLFRFLGKNAPEIEPWIGLLPSSKYSSLICGALKIGFSLVKHRIDLCDKIFATFDKLHDMQLKIEETMELYPKDFKMREFAIQAYVSLLAMIQAMILKLVNERTFTKILEAISRKEHRKRSNGNMTLQEKEEIFYKTLEALDKHAIYLHRKASRSMEKDVKKLGYDVSMVKSTTMSIYAGLMEQDVQISEGFANLQKTQGRARDDLLSELQALKGELKDEFEGEFYKLQANLQDEFSRMCMCRHQVHDYTTSLAPTHPSHHPVQPNFIRTRLLHHLNATHLRTTAELAATSAVPLLLSDDRPFHTPLQTLLRSPRLHTFLTTPSSALLPLLYTPHSTSLFTPLTILTAALISALSPNTHVLHFTTAFHTLPTSPFFGPAGLLRSLLVQLLSAPDLIAEADLAAAIQHFHPHDLASVGPLCALFSALLHNLPPGAELFIVIDGLQLFTQNEEMERGVRAVVAALEGAVGAVGWRAVLKVVVTGWGGGGVEALRVGDEEGEEDEEWLGGYGEGLRGMMDGRGARVAFEDAVGGFEIGDEFD